MNGKSCLIPLLKCMVVVVVVFGFYVPPTAKGSRFKFSSERLEMHGKVPVFDM